MIKQSMDVMKHHITSYKMWCPPIIARGCASSKENEVSPITCRVVEHPHAKPRFVELWWIPCKRFGADASLRCGLGCS